MKKVLFVCSGGMSSAIVEKALDKAAEKKGVKLESQAVGSGMAQDMIQKGEWDIVLVAPQVKHQFSTIKNYADKKGLPIELIQPRDYSPLGGDNLLKMIVDESLKQ